MATYLGLEWTSKGWFGASRSEDRWDCDLFPTVWSAWRRHADADRILIDAPIGLPGPDDGRRRCDALAKEFLGERQASVFYTPIREAVYETRLEEAKAINEEAGYSIQNQAWSVVPRIREVDEFLDTHPGARDRMRETHPEVCYRALRGAPLTTPPNSADGPRERREVLIDAAPDLEGPLDEAIDRFTSPRYAPLVTDPRRVQDAFVAALTASRSEEGLATLPVAPPEDDRGLPMAIVYPTEHRQLTLVDA